MAFSARGLAVLVGVLVVTSGAERGAANDTLLSSSCGDLRHLTEGHAFLFVAGAHHSGTTLLKLLVEEDDRVSGFHRTGVPADEGQHLQDVYRTAGQLGGWLNYAFNPEAFLSETNVSAGSPDLCRLLAAWTPHWNLSRAVLLEKSPRHVLMTRYLQALFGAERSWFVIPIRHPLGQSRYYWGGKLGPAPALAHKAPVAPMRCGEHFIRQWLAIHDRLRADVTRLRHVRVFQFERFVQGLDVHSPKLADFVQSVAEGTGGRQPTGASTARRLLWYHAMHDDDNPRVARGSEFGWAEQWAAHFDVGTQQACQAVVAAYEGRLNEYGYSLVNLTRLTPPRAFEGHLL